MAVEKNVPTTGTMEEVGSFNEQLMSFAGGKVYIGKGSYADRATFAAAFANLSAKEAELSASFDELSDLADAPGKIGSSTEPLKSRHYIVDGKRTNTAELNLAGMSEARKAFIERDINKNEQTIILVDDDKPDKIMCLNGLRWSGSWEGELDKVFNAKINTEFSGSTVNKIWFMEDIPAGV